MSKIHSISTRSFLSVALGTLLFSAAISFMKPSAAWAQENTTATSPSKVGLAVGDTAPDFELKDLEGHSISLQKLTSKTPVVLVVLRGWPGYQCPACFRQVGDMMVNAKKLSADKVQVVFIYPGPNESLDDHAKDFLKDRKLPENFHLVTDPGYKFTELYHLRWDEPNETAYPSTFVIDTDNKIKFAEVSRTHGGRVPAETIIRELKN